MPIGLRHEVQPGDELRVTPMREHIHLFSGPDGLRHA
jgi:hypothetical protein